MSIICEIHQTKWGMMFDSHTVPLQVQLAPVRQCSRTQARYGVRDQELTIVKQGSWTKTSVSWLVVHFAVPIFLLTFYIIRTIGLVYFSLAPPAWSGALQPWGFSFRVPFHWSWDEIIRLAIGLEATLHNLSQMVDGPHLCSAGLSTQDYRLPCVMVWFLYMFNQTNLEASQMYGWMCRT